MSDNMARDFALSVFKGIKEYISMHRDEFASWETEQKKEED